jgi:hypothetical protein
MHAWKFKCSSGGRRNVGEGGHIERDCLNIQYSELKITESSGNVAVRGENRWKEQEGSAIVNSLSEHV